MDPFEKIKTSIYDLYNKYLYKKKNSNTPNIDVLASSNLDISSISDYSEANSISNTFLPDIQSEIDNIYEEIDNIPIGSGPIEIVNTSNLVSTGVLAELQDSTTDTGAVIIGYEAGTDRTLSTGSVYIGLSAGDWGKTGTSGTNKSQYSVAIGYKAGHQANNMYGSVFIGNQTGEASTCYGGVDQYATFIGYNAGKSSTSKNCIFVGESAGYNTTSENDGVVLYDETFSSVFIGNNAGYNAINAYKCVFAGHVAGKESGKAGTSLMHNIFIGSQCGYHFPQGRDNIFIGEGAGGMDGFPFITTSKVDYSIWIGHRAGHRNSLATSSIFIGPSAGNIFDTDNTTAGDWSIAIGYRADTGTYNRSISMGYDAWNTASDQFLLADSITQMSLRGINYTLPTANGAGVLTNDGAGNLSWV